MQIRPLTTLEDFRTVLALEQEVWGYPDAEDAVPVPLMVVNAKIGGVMLGAFDDDGEMLGFVYAVPGFANGRAFHWSHMTGVVERAQGEGIGWRLKRAQRLATLALGLDLVEWTFDPLQAANAHFNFAKLGVRAREYRRNVYGASPSPLHAGTASDRLIAEWHLRDPRVTTLMDEGSRTPAESTSIASNVPMANAPTSSGGRWPSPGRPDLSLRAPRLGIVIPTGFTELQQKERALACEWRDATRALFEAYLRRGYEVSEFLLDREAKQGTYILDRT